MASEKFSIPYPTDETLKKEFAEQYGLNAYYSGKHWAVRRQDAESWHHMVRTEIRLQKCRTVPFEKPVELYFYWNDGLDLSNHAVMAKMIEDAMIGVIIKGDGKKYVVGIHHYFHDKNVIGVGIKEVG